MSTAPTEPAQSTPQAPAPAASSSGKKKNNKKKKNANKAKPADAAEAQQEGNKNGGEVAETEDLSDEPETPGLNALKDAPADIPPSPNTIRSAHTANGHAAGSNGNGHAITPAPLPQTQPPSPTTERASTSAPALPSSAAAPSAPMPASTATETETETEAPDRTSAKLAVMSEERESLRAEVEQLRRQLESVQASSTSAVPSTSSPDGDAESEIAQLRAELKESEAGRERAEEAYETLLGRVEKIKATLGDRLKSDKAELEAAKDRIEELESEREALRKEARAREDEAVRLRAEAHEQARELAGLRSRSGLSQQNWAREKEDLARQVAHLKSELESTSNAMGEWEVIAMEERSMREGLAEKVADLEEQVTGLRDAYEKAAAERDTQGQAVDGLQRALGEIQEARKRELREMVETSEEQLQAMKKRVQEADARAAEAEAAKETLSKELERTVPFEKEVKEKNLLIGKLRHEAIVLNDHLTKALKYIKKTKPEETIDRQIVTNHFLQFLALDRSDPKKFQILQVIAGLLNWTDEQREQSGLARPGTSTNSLRLPTSPFHRTPSSPALNNDFFETSSVAGKESLADLWAGFLERSVEEATGPGSVKRKDSMSSVATTGTTRPDTRGQS